MPRSGALILACGLLFACGQQEPSAPAAAPPAATPATPATPPAAPAAALTRKPAPAGAMAYFQYLDQWRTKGDFEGLEFR